MAKRAPKKKPEPAAKKVKEEKAEEAVVAEVKEVEVKEAPVAQKRDSNSKSDNRNGRSRKNHQWPSGSCFRKTFGRILSERITKSRYNNIRRSRTLSAR